MYHLSTINRVINVVKVYSAKFSTDRSNNVLFPGLKFISAWY